MSDIEYLELGIIEFEKDLEDDANNEWLKRTIAGMKKCYQRLESIDNAEPSEALKCLKELDSMQFCRSIDTYVPEIKSEISETQYLDNTNEFYIIKQALIKAQENEKVLSIIKEKRVNVDLFWNNFIDNGFGYHYYLEKWYKYQNTDKQKLTEEEFDLLKR